MSGSVRDLTFRIQSDFSNADSGVNAFIDNFRKLDTLATDFGTRMSDAISAAMQPKGASKTPSVESILPFQAITTAASALDKNIQTLYANVVKLEDSLSQQPSSRAFDKDIQTAQDLEKALQKVYTMNQQLQKGLGQQADLSALQDTIKQMQATPTSKQGVGFAEQLKAIQAQAKDLEAQLKRVFGSADIFNSGALDAFSAKIGAAMEKVDQSLDKLGNRREVLSALGLDKLAQQGTDAAAALQKDEDALQALKDKLAGLQDSAFSRLFNADSISGLNNALPKLSDQLAKVKEQVAQAAEAMSKLGAGSSPQEIAKAQEAMDKALASAQKLSEGIAAAGQKAADVSGFRALNGIMGDMTLQSALLAAGFFGWMTVIQTASDQIKSAVTAGVQFQETMVQLGNATGLADEQVRKAGEGLRQLSTASGTPLQPLVDGFKNVVQQGYSVADAEKIAAVATRDTLAFMTDQATAAGGLARALHDWGAAANQASQYNELIAESAIKGNTSFETMIQQFNQASTVAQKFHISQTELAADLATVAERTGNASNAGNQLNLLFTRMQENSDKLQQAVAAVDPSKAGFFSPEALNSAGGMQRALEALLEVGARFPSVWKAGLGVFSSTDELINLTGGDSKDLAANLLAVSQAFNGQLTPAADGATKQLATTDQQIKILNQHWEDLKRDFGGAIAIPVLDFLLKIPLQIGQNFQGLGKLLHDIVTHDLAQLGKDIEDPNLYKINTKAAYDSASQAGEAAGQGFSEGLTKSLRAGPGGSGAGSPLNPYLNQLKKTADSDTGGIDSAASDIVAKVSSSISQMTKGIEDAFKLLANIKNAPKIPDNLDQLLTPVVAALKKMYDNFAEGFKDIRGYQATNLDAIIKSVIDDVKAISDGLTLFKDLPSVNVSDPSGKIDALIAALVSIQKKMADAFSKLGQNQGDVGTTQLVGDWAKAVGQEATALKDVAAAYKDINGTNLNVDDSVFQTLATSAGKIHADLKSVIDTIGGQGGDPAALSAIAELIGREATALKDVASLYKDMAGVSLNVPDSSFERLASTAGKIHEDLKPILAVVTEDPETMGKIAEALGREATALKDVAALYKDMSGVNLSQPDSSFATLAATAGKIHADLGPILQTVTGDPDTIGKIAEALGREATALKDVAALFKDMNGVNLNQPDSSFARLATTAGKIHADLGPILQTVTGDPDTIGKIAEALGREATALKDVAALFKDMEGVSLSQPDSSFATLAATAGKIHAYLAPVLQTVTGDPDTIGKIAEALGREATALKDVAELMTAMATVNLAHDPTPVIDGLIKILEHVNNSLSPYLASLGSADYSKAAQSAAAIVTAVKDTAEAISALGTLPVLNEQTIEAKMDSIVNILESTVSYFDQHLAELAHDPKVLGGMATDAADVMKGISDAIKAIDDLSSLPTISENQIEIRLDQVINVMKSALEYFDKHLAEVSNDPKLLADIATDSGNLMKGISDSIKAISDLEGMPIFDSSKIEQGLDKVIDSMKSALEYFDKQLGEMGNSKALGAIATDAGNLMKGIGEAIKDITDLGLMPDFDMSKIRGSLDQVVDTMKSTLLYFEQKMGKLQQDPAISKIASDASAVMEAVNNALKAFETLGKGGISINPQVIAKSIDAAIAAAKYFIADIEASGIDEGELAKVSQFAEMITKILEAVDKINKGVGLTGGSSVPNIGAGAFESAKQAVLNAKGIVDAMQATPGDATAKAFAGIDATQKLVQQTYPQGQGNPFSGLLGSPFSGTLPSLGSLPIFNTPKEPTHIPHPSAAPKAPEPHPAAIPKAEQPTNLDVDIYLDGQKLGESLNNRMFKGQTLRGQAVVSPT